MLVAVIKLLPKGGDQMLLKNWRPISVLNSPYKLIAKLLACRMKALVPRLVDSQQTRFVQDKNIQDNILTLMAVQEKAKHNKTPLAMLRLDFAKAYDRVDHSYT
jgi:hypothetical protein